jgi:phosphate transport system protein
MAADHTVRSFDRELEQLKMAILELGELTLTQFTDSMRSFTAGDITLSARIMEKDNDVDECARALDNRTVRLLALRQPVAQDLRSIIAALRISIDLERIADYAFNVAERTLHLPPNPPSKPVATILTMGQVTQEMLHEVMEAYRRHDASMAARIWSRDQEVDAVYSTLLVELRAFMIRDPQRIDACTDLLFITKSIERVGDHIKNIAEHIYYAVHGTQLHEAEAM